MSWRFLTLAVTCVFYGAAHGINITIPTSPPSTAQPLSRTLISFSLEQDRWPDWTGTTSRNEFTHAALTALGALTGQSPKIRVGANSEDKTTWSSTEALESADFPPPSATTPYTEGQDIVVGDAYYTLSRFLPHGTHMTWGVNLGADNATNAVNMANAIGRAFASADVQASGVVLDLIEVGNEPDLYGSNGLRASSWSVDAYVPDWISIAGAVVEAAGINGSAGPVSLQGASFIGRWTPRQIFDLGILDSEPGKAISVISQHGYSAAFCDGGDFQLTSFMNKASIRGNLTEFEADIAATKARGLRYILGETNSIACHGAPGVSNTAGAALWTIDYTLQAATLGIEELYYHDGIGYKYNFMQPISLNRSIIDNSPLDPPEPPHIQPPFYGGLLVNTLIGASRTPARITELTVADDNVTGYAAYDASGTLVRAVFVNLHAWLVSSTGDRPVVHLDFAGVEGSVKARRLVIDHADDTANLTWAGQSYENEAVRSAGAEVVESVVLADGVDLRATEAILLEF